MIKAVHEGKGAGSGQAPVGGFQAEYPAQRCRHSNRPAGVRAQGYRHHSCAHRCRRTAGRAAGATRVIVRIARGAIVRIFRHEPVSQFFHVERADQHRPGTLHARDDGGVRGSRRIGCVHPGTCQRHHAFDVKQVFHGIGHARQRRQRHTPRLERIDRRSFALRAFESGRGKTVQIRVARVYQGFGFRQHRRGATRARADLPHDVGGRSDHGRNTGAASDANGSGHCITVCAIVSSRENCSTISAIWRSSKL